MNIEPAKRLSNNVWWIPSIIGAVILSISTYNVMHTPKPPPQPQEWTESIVVGDEWIRKDCPANKGFSILPRDGEVYLAYNRGNTVTIDTDGAMWDENGGERVQVRRLNDPVWTFHLRTKRPGTRVNVQIIWSEYRGNR